MIQQYIEQRTNTTKPTAWSIDDYDGELSWEEIKQQPNDEYREYHKADVNQYHKLMHRLYQLESDIDDLIKRQETNGWDEEGGKEWQRIRDFIKEECMNANKETEGKCEEEDIEV